MDRWKKLELKKQKKKKEGNSVKNVCFWFGSEFGSYYSLCGRSDKLCGVFSAGMLPQAARGN